MNIQAFEVEMTLGEQHGAFSLAQGWKTKQKNWSAENNESFEVFLE